MYHSNRTVIHPDYVGLGLGLKMINACSKYMRDTYKFIIMAKFSNIPLYKARLKCPHWKLVDYGYDTGDMKVNGKVRTTTRKKVKWYSFKWVD